MQDPFHRAALETYDALLAADLDVEVISEPEYRRVDDIEFVASYANYYACNGGIVAAQFGDGDAEQESIRCAQAALSGSRDCQSQRRCAWRGGRRYSLCDPADAGLVR